jgi:carbon storage regulator
MLILSRRLQERILIGKDIVITLVDTERGKARIGIQAPDDVEIYREELLPEGIAMPERPQSLYRFFKCLKCPGSFLTRHDRERHECPVEKPT